MKLKLKIKKQHLAGANYISNYDCPVARALKGLGYKDVSVLSYCAFGEMNGEHFLFKFDLSSNTIFDAQRDGNKPFAVEMIRTRRS